MPESTPTPGEIRDNVLRALEGLRRKVGNLKPILKQVGLLLESRAQRAFQEKKLGEFTWPVQYPRQAGPFLHVAGALEDLNERANIKAKRFVRVDVLTDTGNLRHSIKSRVVGDLVEIGSVLPYAGMHQWGGISVQPITARAKAKYAEIVTKLAVQLSRGRGRRPMRDPVKEAKRAIALHAKEEKMAALAKLGFVLTQTTKRTKIFPRPFLGITPEDAAEIREAILTDFLGISGDAPGITVEAI